MNLVPFETTPDRPEPEVSRSRPPSLKLLGFSLLVLLCAAAWGASRSPAPAPINGISQFRRLSVEEMRRGRPLRLEGAVTFLEQRQGFLLLQEGAEVVRIDLTPALQGARVGDRIAVEGTTCEKLPLFQGNPTQELVCRRFATPTNVANRFVARLRGTLWPPRDGDYSFWVCASEGAELWLSPDATPERLRRIVRVKERTPQMEWEKSPTQHSERIRLKGGQPYCIEARYFGAGGNDHLFVAWDGPEIARTIIPSEFLSAWEPGSDHGRAGAARSKGVFGEYWTQVPTNLAAAFFQEPRMPYISKMDRQSAGRLPLPQVLSVGDAMSEEHSFCWSVCEGDIGLVSPTPEYLRLDLIDGDSSLPVRVMVTNATDVFWLRNSRVRVSGVCEARGDLQGKVVPGLFWAPSLDQIEILRPAGEYWSTRPVQTVGNLGRTNWSRLSGMPVRLRGRIVSAPAPNRWEVEDGSGRFRVQAQKAAPLGVGMAMDVVGALAGGPGQFLLTNAFCRLAPELTNAPGLAGLPILKKLGDIKALSVSEADRKYPVDVQGIVLYHNGWVALYDGTAGLQVNGQVQQRREIHLGQHLRVQGHTSSGEFAPEINATNCVILGEGKLPEPSGATLEYLLTGKAEHTWVELAGVVRSISRSNGTLHVMGRNGQFRVSVKDEAGRRLPAGLAVDSTIRVRGDCGALANARRQHIGVDLLVCSVEEIEVIEPAPPDPFAMPAIAVTNLLRWDAGQDWLHRVRISGVVTHCADRRSCYVQNETGGVLVKTARNVNLKPGDRIDAVGFPDPQGYSATLNLAVVRKSGSATLPSPQAATLENLVSGELDARRIRVHARVLEQQAKEGTQVLTLEIQERYFRADLGTNQGVLPRLPPGSLLAVTGICSVSVDANHTPQAFELHLNSPDDVAVLERPSWWTLPHTLSVLAALLSILLAISTWVILLRRQVVQRTRELKEEIEERKRMQVEVDKTHKELLQASRQAGMAEVATNVLHNVGNVLNSVNVSATLVADRLEKLEIPYLQKTADLIAAHAHEPNFLNAHAKGKQLPRYLKMLGEQFARERAAGLEELKSLTKNIDHIKEIVAMQQAYSRMSGVTESVKVSDLVEDAFRLNAESLERHAVKVERDYQEDPVIVVDKHRVLQILVNLIRNAQNACDESERQDKCLRLQIARMVADRIAVRVTDNGVGIPAENMERIFTQGFTTRKYGHGYGLHSSVLASRELGGNLTAASDGLGTGATFTLELPAPKPDKG